MAFIGGVLLNQIPNGRSIAATGVRIQQTLSSRGDNQSVVKSLLRAGVDALVNRGVTPSKATNFKMFPGGGGEPEADYGGSSYTIGDVTFSIQPANQGPATFGDAASKQIPSTKTRLGAKAASSVRGAAKNKTASALKKVSMKRGLGSVKPGSF